MVGNFSLPSEALDNCSGILYCFSQWASDVTTGMFWVMALLSFVVIIFLATMRLGTNRAFGFASFVGLIGGVWLSILTLIPWWMGSAFIITGVVGIAVLLINERD